jgi:hypothetical protein
VTLDLTDDEAAALVIHLRHALEHGPFPFAPRLDLLKAILAKLEPPTPQVEPPPPHKGWHGVQARARAAEAVRSRARMNLDLLNKWLAAGANLAVIVGVVAAMRVFFWLQTLSRKRRKRHRPL